MEILVRSWSVQAWNTSPSAPPSPAAVWGEVGGGLPAFRTPLKVCGVASAVWGLLSSKQRKGPVLRLLLLASADGHKSVAPPPPAGSFQQFGAQAVNLAWLLFHMSQILIGPGAQRYRAIPRLQDRRLGSANDDVLKELRECEMTHRDALISL